MVHPVTTRLIAGERLTKRQRKALELDTDLIQGLPAEEATRRIMKAWKVGDMGKRVACFYLADLADHDGWEKLHHPTLEAFCRDRLGKGVSTVRNYIRAGRSLPELPVIDGMFYADELSFSVIERLSSVADSDTDPLWAKWARRKTFEEVQEKVSKHVKGDKPTDPERRRTHTKKTKVLARLSGTQEEIWERYRAKVQAETGSRPSDLEMMLFGANLGLSMEADGTAPGWKRVRSSCYTIHASPMPEGGPDDLLVRDMKGQIKRISWRELALAAFEAQEPSAEPWPEETVPRGDTSLLDPDNNGSLVPEELRDRETPEWMQKQVLDRDGHCCVICGSRRNLMAHHVHWRCYGGRTALLNLVTACEGCHSMIHERLMVVLIDFRRGLRCYAPNGRALEKRPENPVEPPTVVRAAEETALEPAVEEVAVEQQELVERQDRAPIVNLASLPWEVDMAWLQRHMGLLGWNERQRVLELTPGFGRAGPAGDLPSGAPAQVELGDVIGQRVVRQNLLCAIESAKRQARQVDHLLFTGGPGLGKTLLAEAVAGELGTSLTRLVGPLVASPDVLIRALLSLPDGGVLFVDELQGLPERMSELFYEALDKGTLSLPVREVSDSGGLAQRTVRVRLPRFTLIGATTDADMVTAALRSRLVVERLEHYEEDELAAILTRAARAEGFELEPTAARRLARASRATPREALRLLKSVRDQAVNACVSVADVGVVERALARRGIDSRGYGPHDRRYLRFVGANGPVSQRTIASELGMSKGELEELCEWFLKREGCLKTTPRGRVLTAKGQAELRRCMAEQAGLN